MRRSNGCNRPPPKSARQRTRRTAFSSRRFQFTKFLRYAVAPAAQRQACARIGKTRSVNHVTARTRNAARKTLRRMHAQFYPRERLSRNQSLHEEIVSTRPAEARDLLPNISEAGGGNIRLQPRPLRAGEFNQSVARTEQRDVTE